MIDHRTTYVQLPACQVWRRSLKREAREGRQHEWKCAEVLMKVIVQQRDRKLFLGRDEEWTAERRRAAKFATVVDAVSFCIHCRAREVKIVGKNDAGEEVYLYPFGGDPLAKAESKNLRRRIRENRRLRTEERLVRARIERAFGVRKGNEEALSIQRE